MCIVDCINHIHMYFIGTNAFETIVGVDVVLPSKIENFGNKIIFEVILVDS